MKTPTTILATLVATALSGAAFAEGESKTDFSTMDADADGSITQEEAQASPDMMDKWAEYDANTDGVVDEAEFSELHGKSNADVQRNTGDDGEDMEEAS